MGTRYVPPDWFTTHVFNPLVAGLTRLGISVLGSRILAVRGRKSGRWRTTPVNLLRHDGSRYLVAPRGVTQWVRNVRAGSDCAPAPDGGGYTRRQPSPQDAVEAVHLHWGEPLRRCPLLECDQVKVVGLGGSLAAPSRSLGALRAALAGAAEAGAETDLLDLRELQLPLYVPGGPLVPDGARRLLEAAGGCDAMVWSSPLYQGTVSGAFKNALDWLHLLGDHEPAYLTDQVIGLVATAGGVQGMQAVNTMEFSVRSLRAFAVPLVVTVAQAARAFDAEGNLTDATVRASLMSLGNEVARIAARFQDGKTRETLCAKAAERLALTAA